MKIARVFSIIAAICYIICGTVCLLEGFLDGFRHFFDNAIAIACAVTAVFLFIKNLKASVIPFILQMLIFFFKIFFVIYDVGWDLDVLPFIVAGVAYLIVLALTILCIEKNKSVQKLWFVPSVLVLCAYLLLPYFGSLTRIIFYLLFAVPLFFVGLWLKAEFQCITAPPKEESAPAEICICKICGEEIPEGMTFCPKCWTPVNESDSLLYESNK